MTATLAPPKPSPLKQAVADAAQARIDHQAMLARQEAMFGPGWIICPFCYSGIHRSDLRPCACGAQVLIVVASPNAAIPCRKVCRRCAGQYKTIKSTDTIVGELDVKTGRFTRTR